MDHAQDYGIRKRHSARMFGANANITIDSIGESVGDKNMQPYEVVYIWERTA